MKLAPIWPHIYRIHRSQLIYVSGCSIAAQQPVRSTLSTEHLHADLKGRSVRGGLLTLTSQGAQFLIQSVSTVVLARLLTPADFGLVAMVTAITGLGQAFADLGLSEATIQRQEINHDQVSTLFWINVAIGLALMLITIGLAPVLAWFYREPRLKDITFAAVFDVPHRRTEGTARCASQAPDAVYIPGHSGCGCLCSRCPCRHHAGLARSGLLGVSRSSPDIELDSNGAFLVDGRDGCRACPGATPKSAP